MSKSARLGVAIITLLLAASDLTVPVIHATGPEFESATCPFQMPPGQVEGDTVDCGFLSVPENRADPDSRTIRLAVAIFHPAAGTGRAEPLVFLEGGPGGSALKLLALRDFGVSYAPLLAAGHQLILLDQRGVGHSEPALDCPDFVELYRDLLGQRAGPDGATTTETVRAQKVEALSECARTLADSADLTAYNTAESASDIEDLRRALGYERLDLWGTSYGSRLALAVMRDHPEGDRSVILDAPFPPQVDVYTAPDAFDRALGEMFDACAADHACGAAYPDLEAVFLETIARLDAEPVRMLVHDPFAGEQRDLVMDGDAFLEQVFRGLYSTAMRQALPGAIYDAREGTFDTLLLVARLDLLRQYVRSWGMYFSVLCHDEVPFSSLDAFEAARSRHPELAGMYDHFEIGPLAFEVCDRWGAGVASDLETEAVHSAIPTLIMTGQYDPIVPPAFGQAVADELDAATFLVFPGLSHGASGTECATQVMLAFLDDPSSSPDPSCLSDQTETPFDLPVEADTAEMEPFSSAALGLSGMRPVDWSEPAPGTFSRGLTATDSTSLALLALPFSADEALTRLAAQVGASEAPAVVDRFETNGLEWQIYRTEIQGAVMDVALAPSGDTSLLVLLTSGAAERDALFEQVFVPAVQALEHLTGGD